MKTTFKKKTKSHFCLETDKQKKLCLYNTNAPANGHFFENCEIDI